MGEGRTSDRAVNSSWLSLTVDRGAALVPNPVQAVAELHRGGTPPNFKMGPLQHPSHLKTFKRPEFSRRPHGS